MNSYIFRNWVPFTYLYVGANYFLQYKTAKFICLARDEKEDTTLWLNFF